MVGMWSVIPFTKEIERNSVSVPALCIEQMTTPNCLDYHRS